MSIRYDELDRTIRQSTAAVLDAIDDLPADQRIESLLLFALEREQVVDVAYSEERIRDLIEALEVDEETREVTRRAIVWLRRDEALHAQYLRGLLLRSRRPRSWATILATQAIGAVGGWCSAVAPNHRSDAFGLRSMIGSSALLAGTAIGRVPRGLVAALRAPGFESFCRVNLTLENSAVDSYERLLPLIDDDRRPHFERIMADEQRHADAFRVFIEHFEGNELRAGHTTADLIADLRAISPWMVPERHRNGARGSERLDEIGVVGRTADDPAAAVDSAFDTLDVRRLVAGKSVALRTNFMLGYDRRDMSNVVSPDVLHAVTKRLRDLGAAEVLVIDAPNIYDSYFGERSVDNVADYLGYDRTHFRLVDATDDMVDLEFARGLSTTMACRNWVEADVRMVLARLVGDPSEVIHGTLPTLAGLTGRIESDQFFTSRLVDHRTAALMLLDAAPIDLAMIDAWGPIGDGPLGVMGCHRPSDQRRFYAGRDPIAVDATVIADLPADPADSDILRRADEWFGTNVCTTASGSELGPFEGLRVPQANWWFRIVAATAVPVYANLSFEGRLFVPAFDEQAFPPLDAPGRTVRSIRRIAQRVFGLHPPPA